LTEFIGGTSIIYIIVVDFDSSCKSWKPRLEYPGITYLGRASLPVGDRKTGKSAPRDLDPAVGYGEENSPFEKCRFFPSFSG